MKERSATGKSRIPIPLLIFVLIAAIAAVVSVSFLRKHYLIVSVILVTLSFVPLFVRFELKEAGPGELAVLAVMTALSVVGRVAFASVPSFKPVSAIVIITGIALGPENGFIVGCTSAIVSNIFFGQGIWTLFQMLAWGAVGVLSGIFVRKRARPSMVLLVIDGIVGGVIFSLIMDLWTTVSFAGHFTVGAYFGFVVTSMPVTAVYVVSNVIFLVLIGPELIDKLTRIKTKYGVFGKYL